MEFKIGDCVFHTKYNKTFIVVELFEKNVTLIGHLKGVGEFEIETQFLELVK